MQAMKHWYQSHPELFSKRPYDHPGCDIYKRGMEETLGEDITYFEERDIDHAFQAHRRDAAKNQVKKIFRALKFYTNSDFTFKEVHNKKLFE